MEVQFDSFDKYETPVVTLANPNKTELGVLGNVLGLQIQYRFNEISEVSFDYPYQDIRKITSPYYEQLIDHRLLHIENHGWWIIQPTSDSDDGIKKYKQITAYSLEYELASKKVNLLDGTYKFYDLLEPDNTLMGELLADTGWSVDYVDADLLTKYRTFEVADDTVYSFLMNTVRNSYECIFVFNTENRTISAYTIRTFMHKSDIFVGYDNLIKNCNVNSVSNEMYTAISVYGDEDLDVSAANPLGTLTIYNYAYFKSPEWMSEGLVTALDNWNTLIELNADRYRDALLNLINSDIDVETLNTQLVDLQTDLAALEQVQGLQISGNIPNDDPATYKKTLDSISSVKQQISAVEKQIKTGQTSSDSYQVILDDINKLLRRENNFTAEQLAELNLYTKEGTFQDDTYITTDIMSQSEKQKVAIDLYDAGMEALKKYSQPSYTIEVDSINYLLLKEYKEFTKQTDLGATINFEVERGHYIEVVLLGITIDFDSPSNFQLTFGNRYKLNSSEWQFSDLYNETSNITNKVNFSYNLIKDWTGRSSEVLDFINGTLDATKNAIVSSSNQEITLDGSGLRGRKLLDSGAYDPKQVWLTSNTLAFTRDNWNTVSTALGELTLPSGATTYGLVADAIVGKMLVGAELYISNETSNFLIDADGIKIKVGDGNTFVNISTTIEGINTSISDIDGNISSLQQTATSLTSTVSDLNGKYTSIKQTVDSIDLEGYVTFTDLSKSGATTINGANITTGTISADRLDLSDCLVIGGSSSTTVNSGNITNSGLIHCGGRLYCDGGFYADAASTVSGNLNVDSQLVLGGTTKINADGFISINGVRPFNGTITLKDASDNNVALEFSYGIFVSATK